SVDNCKSCMASLNVAGQGRLDVWKVGITGVLALKLLNLADPVSERLEVISALNGTIDFRCQGCDPLDRVGQRREKAPALKGRIASDAPNLARKNRSLRSVNQHMALL